MSAHTARSMSFGVALTLGVVSSASIALGDDSAQVGNAQLSFIENLGQFPEPILFTARSDRALLEFSPGQVTAHLTRANDRETPERPSFDSLSVTSSLLGANPATVLVGEGVLPHTTHFYFGNDPEAWRTDVPNYGRVRMVEVYEGIDVVYYSDAGLKYDFIVQPGVDVGQIQVRYDGADELCLADGGDLTVSTQFGPIIEGVPFAYQEIGGVQREVPSSYRLIDERTFGFVIGALHDECLPVVIDPALHYSTYLGGNSFDQVGDIAADCNGSAYVVGATLSSDFPAGSTPVPSTHYSVFVTKFLPDGTNIEYSVFIGGSADQIGYGIAVDDTGRAYVCGDTGSNDFPTTAGAFDTSFNGNNPGELDIFVTQLSPAGLIEYSTYLGGPSSDLSQRINVNPAGSGAGVIEVDVIGSTFGTGYPTTAGAYDTSWNGGVLDMVITRLRLNGAGAADLIYSTYVGGTGDECGSGIRTNAAGDIYFSGSTRSSDFPGSGGPPFNGTFDAVVAKLTPASGGATDLLFAEIMGGSGHDYGFRVDINLGGQPFVTGATRSSNFPTTTGAYQTTYGGGFEDGYIALVSSIGGAPLYSTFLGGTGTDRCLDIAVNSQERPVVVGSTNSAGFPTTTGAFDTTHNGLNDIFVTDLDTLNSILAESTFLGGSQSDFGWAIHVDPLDNWYVLGTSESSNHPITANAFDTTYTGLPMDVCVARFVGPPPAGGVNPCTDLKTSHCNGDGGDQAGCTDCPCSNNAPIGTIGGCLNSVGTSAQLIGSGDTSVSLPVGATTDLSFLINGAPPNAFCILNSGDSLAPQNVANPCYGLGSGAQSIFFDGLRCSIMNTRRHGGRVADVSGDVGVTNPPWGGTGGPPAGIAVAGGGFLAGQRRYFQVIHREDVTLSCMRGLNTSQAVAITFMP